MAHRQKPEIAAWIQRERKRLTLSTAQLSERLALVGAKVGEQTISVWESYADRRPSQDNLDALERIFGSRAPNRETAPGLSDGGGLAQAITLLVEELRAMREERDTVEIRLRALEAELRSRRVPREGEGLPERSAPAVKVG